MGGQLSGRLLSGGYCPGGYCPRPVDMMSLGNLFLYRLRNVNHAIIYNEIIYIVLT